MTLRWIEGFETHTVTDPADATSLAQKFKDQENGSFSSSGTWIKSAGRISGSSYGQDSETPYNHSHCPGRFGADFGGFVLGFGIIIGDIQGNSRVFFRHDGTDVMSFNIVEASSGTGFQIEARRAGGFGTLLGTTTEMPYDSWHYIEIKFIVDGTSGTVEIRNNEVTILDISGVNTDGAGTGLVDQYFMTLTSFAGFSAIDDMYLCDTDGGERNDFLGDQQIEKIEFDADGSFSAFTPQGGGTHVSEIDEEDSHDGDTTYLSTTLADATDTFDKASPSFTDGNITGIALHSVARLTASGSRNLQHVIRDDGDGSIHVAGDTHVIDSQTYKTFVDAIEVHPETGVSFTIAQIEDDQMGFKSVLS